ncbi:MAG TPA: hypothetical protein VNA19_17405 [Pyrinomonadaceae bacterium]|jgi:hypothetical protein|nr:hypothetical protein [Pyrinomonadaceae bacterium]
MSDHPPNISPDRRRFPLTAAHALLIFTLAFVVASCSTENEPPPSAPREFPPIVSTAPANSRATSGSVSPINAAQVAQRDEATQVLFDYRKDKGLARPELPPEELRKIYVAAYGDEYEKLEPLIRSAAEGVFTEAGARQTAYLVQPNSAGEAGDAVPATGANLVIFEGEKLAANVAVGGGNFIRRVNHYASILHLSDLNGDGVNELLLGASYLNRGINISWARLVEVRDGKLKLIRDFGVIDEDTCDTERQARVTSGVIRATTEKGGAWPRFKVDFYRGPCPAGGAERDPSQFRPSAAPR